MQIVREQLLNSIRMQQFSAFRTGNTNSTLADLGLQILDQAGITRRMATVERFGLFWQRQQTDRTLFDLIV